MNYRIIATKTDKLSGNGRARSTKLLKGVFGGTPREPLLVSSATGSGMKELWKDLDRALSDKAAELAGAI